MTWFKLDDQVAFHAKTLDAGNEGFGAFSRAGAWSSGHGTDGKIPTRVALTIANKEIWDHLVTVGFAHEVPNGEGWILHDFLEWNPSAAEVLKLKANRTRAGKASGRARLGREHVFNKSSSRVEQVSNVSSSSVEQMPNKIEAKGTGSGSGSGSGIQRAEADLARAVPDLPEPILMPHHPDLGAVIRAELERYPVLAVLEPAADELAMVAFNHKRGAPDIVVILAEAADKEGPRAAMDGPMAPGDLAKYVSGCLRRGVTRSRFAGAGPPSGIRNASGAPSSAPGGPIAAGAANPPSDPNELSLRTDASRTRVRDLLGAELTRLRDADLVPLALGAEVMSLVFGYGDGARIAEYRHYGLEGVLWERRYRDGWRLVVPLAVIAAADRAASEGLPVDRYHAELEHQLEQLSPDLRAAVRANAARAPDAPPPPPLGPMSPRAPYWRRGVQAAVG